MAFHKMEDTDTLSSFYANICDYFSGSCSVGKCYLVKKHKENMSTDGDFSITLNDKAQKKHAKLKTENNTDSNLCLCNGFETFHLFCERSDNGSHKFNKLQQNIVEYSKKWPLKISKCSVHHERLSLYLNRFHTFEILVPYILFQKSQYGKLQNFSKSLLLTADIPLEDESTMNITDYRKCLLKRVLKNLVTQLGYSVILDVDSETSFSDTTHYHIASNHLSVNCTFDVLVHCGSVIDGDKKCKEKDILMKDHLRKRVEELKVMSRHKHGDQVDNDANWDKFFKKLGESTLQIDLLSVRPSRMITLNFQQDCQDASRKAHFILYNCARLSALQEKFDKKCSEKVYPPLVPIDEIDFSLLGKEEEWELLSGYLLVYPHVLRSTIELLCKGKPTPNLLCHFLYSLCGCYSSYYRRVRVLTEPRDHLLPVMFARLYLLKAVECILHNGLHILGIEPVRYM